MPSEVDADASIVVGVWRGLDETLCLETLDEGGRCRPRDVEIVGHVTGLCPVGAHLIDCLERRMRPLGQPKGAQGTIRRALARQGGRRNSVEQLQGKLRAVGHETSEADAGQARY